MAGIENFTESSPIILLLDLSQAVNSAQACQMTEAFVSSLTQRSNPIRIDILAGNVLLTRSVLAKIKQTIHRVGASIGVVYGSVPQTQQAALDEGLFAKEKLTDTNQPLRQPLPLSDKSPFASRPQELSFTIPNKPETAQAPLHPSEEIVEVNFEVQLETFSAETLQEEVLTPLQTERVSSQESMLQLHIEELGLTHSLPVPEAAMETLYLRQTLRSGQTVRFKGNIVIIGDVHAGSEIVAGGDIIVWGELRGIAHAGAKGDYRAQIRAMKIEALQLRIADYIARKPDRIYYHKEGDSALSPELAKVSDGEIKIFRTILPHTKR